MDQQTRILGRLFDQLGQTLTRESAQKIAALRADPDVQERLDYLTDRNTEGEITAEELKEYEALVTAGEFISILKAKARRILGASAA